MSSRISRQELEKACRVLRKPRKSASMRTLSTECCLSFQDLKTIVATIRAQPFVKSVLNDKGTWLSYGWTNYAPGLIHMSFCAVVCEGVVVNGSESPAAPMFDGDTQMSLRDQYQALASENHWVYLDVTHDHMAHLLDALETVFKV